MTADSFNVNVIILRDVIIRQFNHIISFVIYFYYWKFEVEIFYVTKIYISVTMNGLKILLKLKIPKQLQPIVVKINWNSH